MKKIAFIGHSYHQKTKSFDFFYEILKSEFCVDLYYDESWMVGTPIDVNTIGVSEYDRIILWQQINYFLHPAIRKHPNVILVPMFDCHADSLNEFQRFSGDNNIKFINFCRAQHEAGIQFGLNSLSLQFFPNPQNFDPVENFDELIGFFWPRRKEINWRTVQKLISTGQFSRFYFHTAPDRGFRSILPSKKDRKRYQITFTEWLDKKADFFELLSKSNVFFAPRLYEGIGLSFLEAMAMGLCVVAPNTPTMNEYIIHGVTGLLYDPNDPFAADFSGARRIGAGARTSIINGHKRWVKYKDDILDFVDSGSLGNNLKHYHIFPKADFPRSSNPSTLRNLLPEEETANLLPEAELIGGLRTSGLVKYNTEKKPLITVATVTFNAEMELPGTLASVFDQTYDNIELIIVDGNSTDATLQKIKDNAQYIDLWISQTDRGPYDAMNKAAKLARGKWIIFLNAGDLFTENNIISEVVNNSPSEADIIYGHHYYRHLNGDTYWHKANAFEWTAEMLQKGQLTTGWVTGIPGHQATFTKTTLFKTTGYDIEHYRYAADHDFLFRMREVGSVFHHTGLTIAEYTSGGFSWQNRSECMREQWQIARKYGPGRPVDRFYRKPLRQVKKDQSRVSLSFSKEWYFQEVCFGGWMRWLSKAGDIVFQIEKPSNYLVCFQARSFLSKNFLHVQLNDKPFIQSPLSKRFSFFGPKLMTLDKQVYKFRLTCETEPKPLSLSDPRPVGITVKNFIIMEDCLASKFALFFAKLLCWLTPQFLGNRHSNSNTVKVLNALRTMRTYVVIRNSGLFLPKFYRSSYAKEFQGGIKNPLLHYIRRGACESKNPSPYFDTQHYLDHNPDVAASGVNPLYHYIACGAKEGREPSPYTSMNEHLSMNSDVDPSRINPLGHYLNPIGKNQLKSGQSGQLKKSQEDRPCVSLANHSSTAHRINCIDDILSGNNAFIYDIRQNSNSERVSFLQKRGKLLENFKKEHYLGGVYEEIIRAFYTHYLQRGDVAVDCGAEVGHHTFPLAKIVGSEGLVYAIDARSDSIVSIQNKMRFFTKNIRLFNCALSDWEGKATFTTVDNLPGWSSLVPYEKYPHKVTLRQHPVKVRRLDQIVDQNRHVKFIKLDIEGGEYHALLGAEELIARHRPILVFENGWFAAANRFTYLLEDFLNFFIQNKYELIDILGEPFCYEYFIAQHHVNNFVAIPEELAHRYRNLKSFLWKQAVSRLTELNTLNRNS